MFYKPLVAKPLPVEGVCMRQLTFPGLRIRVSYTFSRNCFGQLFHFLAFCTQHNALTSGLLSSQIHQRQEALTQVSATYCVTFRRWSRSSCTHQTAHSRPSQSVFTRACSFTASVLHCWWLSKPAKSRAVGPNHLQHAQQQLNCQPICRRQLQLPHTVLAVEKRAAAHAGLLTNLQPQASAGGRACSRGSCSDRSSRAAGRASPLGPRSLCLLV